MSRFRNIISKNITVYCGDDHALGKFYDVTDQRFADSGQDQQGEGYVFQSSHLFGIDLNRINATVEQIASLDKTIISELCNNFIKTINN